MNIRTLLACCCAILFAGAIDAKKPENKDNKEIERATQLMEVRANELIAGRVKKEGLLKDLMTINNAALEELMEREKLMFPAEELYGGHWDNRWVNPFQGTKVNYPDSASIDCSQFIIPIDGDVKVTSKYGMRRRRMHRGIDLKVQVGDTIRAAFDGKIRIRSFERRGYGYYLVVRHTNGLETIYGHLSAFLVEEDQIVRAGEAIGLGGNTGRSTGSHLHFETRFLGIDLNPAELIDFENGVPHKDLYVFKNVKVNGRNSNIYTSSDARMAYHRVKSGDTLGAIARRYGTSVSELCRLNGLKSTSTLRIGQSIRINAGSGTIASTQPQEVKKEAATPATLTTTAKSTPAIPPADAVYHTVQSGDTLGAIALKYGTTVKKLCQLNGITERTILKLGRSLRCS